MFTFGNTMDQLFAWVYYKLIGCLNDFTKYLGDMGAELFDSPIIQAILIFFQLLASALLAVGIAMAISEYAIGAETGKTSLRDTAANIVKAMMAAALFTVVPVRLYQLSINVENTIGNAINSSSAAAQKSSASAAQNGGLISGIINVFQTMVASNPVLSFVGSVTGTGDSAGQHVPSIVNLLFLIAFCYGFFKVLFGNLKRGAILMIQICVCPLYIFSLTMGYSDGFAGWCRQIIGLCFTAFMQNILITVGLLLFKDQMVIATGIILAAAEVPRIAGHYGLDTSVKANISSVTYAANSAVSMIRMLRH